MNRPREGIPESLLTGLAGEVPGGAHVDAEIGRAEWSILNQRWLARRFEALCQRLSPPAEPTTDPGPVVPPGLESAHQRLQRQFGLSPFEGELLLLAAGAECDTALRDALTRMEGVAAPPGVNFAVALAHLDGAHWDALSPLAPLRRWQLLRLVGDASLGQARLRIDERVLHHLTGVAAFDPRLQGVARLLEATADDVAAADADTDAVLIHGLLHLARPLLLLGTPLQQAATRREARTHVLRALAALGLQALWVDAGALDVDPRALAEMALALDREALLSDAAIVLAAAPQSHETQGAGEAGPAVLRLLSQLQGPVLLLGPIAAAELADLPERRCVRWALSATPTAAAGAEAAARDPALRAALQQFQVDDDALQQALSSLPAAAAPSRGQALWQHLRQARRGGLDGLALRIESSATLADMVLPAAALDTLRDITLQLRHRAQVHEDWGFATPGGRGLGLAALFAGDSGTGKTFAAEAIANEVGLDLYRIDLALTVSKYIGETEKNLRRLFEAAEGSGAVLLFDEADALFGKRSDVKDSHDRYANIEVAYLLQRIESYRGLAILTTNLKSALDRAFLRRLRFVVNFPFPDEAAREALWRRQFPAQAPLAGDVDWRALARLHLTGGHIRSVALNGAFRAAADGGVIAQRHLIEAARAEYQKLERSFGTAGGTA